MSISSEFHEIHLDRSCERYSICKIHKLLKSLHTYIEDLEFLGKNVHVYGYPIKLESAWNVDVLIRTRRQALLTLNSVIKDLKCLHQLCSLPHG